MADTQAPVNGNYPVPHAYHDSYNHAHAVANNASNFQPAQSTTPTNVPPSEQKNAISKDEVGWYFVEQYYTNMSRSPDKLHLFYSRRSQLVFGTEAESVPVAVGQKAINEKIKQLDFQDCKVRVLNVDSQASFDNILISVIGEISNKSEPSRKFIQTFVLAEQPNGYYVLNDIFRYLVDEEDIVNEEPAPAAPAEPVEPVEPATEPAADEPAQLETESAPTAEPQDANEVTAAKVDEKLEQVEEKAEEKQPEEPAPQANGTEAQSSEDVQEPPALAESEASKTEKPATPEPTPAPTTQKETAAPAKEPVVPARAVPKTWANIASKSGATAPVVPAIPVAPVKPAPVTSSAQSVPTPPAAAATPTPAAESTPSQPPSNDGSGWQTAGHDHKKTQPRAGDDQNVMAYIKNVTDKVDANLLKQTLSRFGKLKHFDVSRQKNCAFVEFADPAGYTAAVAANPHQIGSEQISVEERRSRTSAYGGNTNYGAGRGGSGRGRGDRAGSQGRGGFQRDGRGGFAPRGRGGSGNVNAKARNQAQTA
ncbi:NTF2 and RRM domain protein [Aspergillus nomiae NRRL 13137]|uniref:NTF2 and RRM domain protein n=1 Tax=Aspergillus nomiae NRRL (strain ATCC 15546 / NRRL 13137 / CBS 260.88 / M93) TaxID=1509407 RepID=A0A0L1ILP2_ASPN3|nr:NTF2 and RRM domain protein [Aspergillus nomiae NRRL 13137]KNG80469.1 NTF2 and RRM domain protein [Aspergillus nomiae NRRL 13137]